MKKKIILILVRYYLPGHKAGGPVRSIANMVELLGDEFDFYIITSDRDLLDTKQYENIIVDGWNQVGKAKVYYLPTNKYSLIKLVKLLSVTSYDVMYLNSFFDPLFTQGPLFARFLKLIPLKPVVIAPRGEFSKAALSIKRWKKMPFMLIMSVIGIYRNLNWHASSDHEKRDINHALSGLAHQINIAIAIASDLASPKLPISNFNFHRRNHNEPLRVIFLSRIAQMKNLDFALRVLKRVKTSICFHIYGPIEDNTYWNKCEDIILELPSNVSVQYCGAVDHSLVLSTIRNYDLFFLPTRGENYGHVIMESFTVGTPVLIADTTPWRNLQQYGVGWDISLDNEQLFADKISDAAKILNEAYVEWRAKVQLYAALHSSNPEIIISNRRLFSDLVS